MAQFPGTARQGTPAWRTAPGGAGECILAYGTVLAHGVSMPGSAGGILLCGAGGCDRGYKCEIPFGTICRLSHQELNICLQFADVNSKQQSNSLSGTL
jgi:hypothetical protein